MEKYMTRSVEELTKTLITLAKRVHSPGLPPELTEFVCMLKAQKLRHSNDAHVFCKCGGMQVLVGLLKQCAVDSRDSMVVLGTVGNLCALNHHSRTKVMEDGLEAIVNYLHNSTDSDCICITARVLANLALSPVNIAHLLKHGLVQHLSRVLAEGEVDMVCKTSVVRAIRLLCTVEEGLEELKQNEGLPHILLCLKSDHVELAVGAVQALEVATAGGDSDVLQHLCKKDILQCVVRYCGNSKSKVKKSAVNILIKSTKLLDGRIALSSAGGIEALVLFLDTVERRSEIFHNVVGALCTCCRDVMSRQHLRDSGGLEKLITMLADPIHKRLHGAIMAALVCFYFDETTLKMMVTKMKLLQTLSYHLKNITSRLKDGACEQIEAESEKEPGLEVAIEMADPLEGSSTQLKEEHLKVCQSETERSPQSDFEYSPPRKRLHLDPIADTPSRGTLSVEMGDPLEGTSSQSEDEEVKGSQSETDQSDAENPVPRKRLRLDQDTLPSGTSSANFLDSLLSSPSPYRHLSKPHPLPSSPLNKSTLESQVILMVSRMSHMKDCLVSLSYSETLLSILNYFLSVRPPNMHVFKVLTRVFSNAHCFHNCISNMVPSKIHETIRSLDASPSLSDEKGGELVKLCQSLMTHISKNAESPYGRGALAHLLLRGNDKDKQASCLSMPLLCKTPRVCQTLMVTYGAFEVLCNLLKDEESSVWELAVDSMLTLAHNMQKQHVPRHRRYPIRLDMHAIKTGLDSSFKDLSLSEVQQHCVVETLESNVPETTRYCRYMDTDHHPFDLTLVLHPPSGPVLRVPAHKSTLVEHSDVFRVMLDGSYRESSGGEVHIHSISPLAFLSLLHHLYGCGWQCRAVRTQLVKTDGSGGVGMDEAPSHTDPLVETSGALLRVIVSGCRNSEEGERMEHCLQVVACAGRFLLPDLMTLSEHKATCYLCAGNVVAVFHFARLHQCFCLAESCVRALVSLPDLHVRTETFKELLTSSEGEAAIQIILLFLTAADF